MTHYELLRVNLGHTVDGLERFFADLQDQNAEIADLEMYLLELRDHEKELEKISDALQELTGHLEKACEVRF